MDAVINIRTDKKTRDEAKKIFAKMGLTTSAGINMFLRQVVTEKGIPFKPTRDPKKIRAAWDKDIAETLASGKYYTDVKALMKDLNAGI